MKTSAGYFNPSLTFIILFCFLGGGKALAEFSVNGYGTIGATKTDYEHTYEGWTNDSVDYVSNTQFALNLVKELSQKFSLNAQLMSRGRYNFDARLRLLNINWTPSDSSLVRIGKIRAPLWLISEYQEVGVLYPWSRPPGELYVLVPFDTVTGVFGSKTFTVAEDIKLILEIIGGGGPQESKNKFELNQVVEVEGELKDLIGFNFHLRSKNLHLRTAIGQADYSGTAYQHSVSALTYTQTTTAIGIDIQDAKYLSAGLRYQSPDFLVLSEIVTLKGTLSGKEQNLATSHYVTAGIYLGKSFMVHGTRAALKDTETTTKQGDQYTHGIGVNYFYTPDLVVKVDYRNVKVTGGAGNFTVQPDRNINVGDVSLNFSF